MKKFLFILAAAMLMVAGCGTKDDINSLKKEIQSLKEADAALWAEMSAAIDKLEKDLTQRIQDTRDRLNKSIDEAVEDLMDLMDSKLQKSQQYLDTELAAKKKLVDTHVSEVKNKTNLAVSTLDQSLDISREMLLDAINKNDKEQEAMLRQLSTRIANVSDDLEEAQKKVKQWQTRLNELHDKGLFDAINKLQSDAQKLQEFSLQGEVNKMEERLKRFADIKMDELPEQQMKEVNKMLSDMYDWYDEMDRMVSEADRIHSDMEGLLSDWESNASNLESDLDSYLTDIATSLDDLYSYLDDSYSSASDLESDVIDIESELTELNENLTDYSQRIDAMSDDWDGQHGDLESLLSDLYSASDDVCDKGETLMSLVDNYIDNHPWMFD